MSEPPRGSGPLAVARMAGSSIAAPGALPWVADFLNAAFYARRRGKRTLADLRLAHGILTTRWAQRGRRLGARDLGAFHRAFGAARVRGLGRLDREALRAGGAKLLGEWFPEAWDDAGRRAYGIAFPTRTARHEFDPGLRLYRVTLGEPTPPREPPERQRWETYPPVPLERQRWETYPPVPLPDPEAALALIRDPARWPDIASAAGRFTPVRRGGLPGQTFEILLALHPVPRALLATRGYVTCTAVHLRGERLRSAAGRAGEQVEALPEGADPLAYIELTTHAGHFMGRAISRLLAFEGGGEGFVRDIGSWDPLPPHLAAPYAAGGRASQKAFWGPDDPESSMLIQLAEASISDRV